MTFIMHTYNKRNNAIEMFLLDGRRLHKQMKRHFYTVVEKSPDEEIRSLTLTQALLLLLIFRTSKAMLAELADLMEVSAPTVSVQVDRLYHLGLICRDNRLSDRRKVCIQVHTKAIEKIKRLDAAMQKKLSELTNTRGAETFWAAHEALLESFSAGCEKAREF